MANPWDNDPIVQQQGPQVIELPRTESERREASRRDREEGYDRSDQSFADAASLRKEFMSRPSVVNYNVALGTFNSARNTAPTPEGDQSLIVSFARMLDPNSVVREGEFVVAADNESSFNKIKAKVAKEFGLEGGGRLTDEGRRKLRAEMLNLVTNRFKAPYDQDRYYFSRLAQSYGQDPFRVIGPSAEEAFPENLLAPIPDDVTGAGIGASDATTTDIPYPEEGQRRHAAMVRRLIAENDGRLPADEYAAERAKLDQDYGLETNTEANRVWAGEVNTALKLGASVDNLNLGVAPKTEELNVIEQGLNTAVQNPYGAGAANFANAAVAGIPGALAGQENLDLIRENQPLGSFVGELGGGTLGALLTGGALGAGGRLAAADRAQDILTNPMVADTAYSSVYGGLQDTENPFRGAVAGATGSVLGNYAGRALGGGGAFNRSGVRAADESVPSYDQLQEQAGDLYRKAEAGGTIAQPESTQEIINTANSIMSDAGRVGPTGEIIGGSGEVNNALRLLRQYEGLPMTPTQAGAARRMIGEGRTAMKGPEPDFDQRRVAGQMLDKFDEWAEPALPGVEQARSVAQRGILGRQIANTRKLADAKSSMFSQSGEENALRNAFRQLDVNEVRGRNSYPPELTGSIQAVTRGTPAANAARFAGKFAPTSAVSAIPSLAAGLGTAGMTGGLTGLATGAGVAGAGLTGRILATRQARRAAEVAELVARGGPEYREALDAAIEQSRRRAALGTGGLFGATGSLVDRRVLQGNKY